MPDPHPPLRPPVSAALVATVLIALAVGFATLLPTPERPPRVPHLDKLAHFGAFFVLVLPLASVLRARGALLALVVLAAVYGGAIELIQPRFGRGAEWLDFGADVAGALAGVALGRWLRPRLWSRWRPARGPAD